MSIVMQKIATMIKESLDWQKAVALAEKAGIVPHPKSNWKWALRQVRAKNPTGAFQSADDLLLKGKDLAKAKEKIGLLPNNVRQKIKALSRKQRLGVEVGLGLNGKYVVGDVGRVITPGGSLAHTHPQHARISLIKETGKELTRVLDSVLKASPSGMPYDATLPQRMQFDKLYKKSQILMRKADKLERLYPKEVNAYGQISPIKDKYDSNLAGALKYLGYASKIVPHGGDMRGMARDSGVSKNIMAPATTGVHKYRPKLPNMTRSVYFKGGLE